MSVEIRHGHVLDSLREMPGNSVHMVCTSPPYYGLRAYGTEPQVWGGDPEHMHEFASADGLIIGGVRGDTRVRWQHNGHGEHGHGKLPAYGTCACGAWLGELGSEPTPDCYVEHLLSVFAEVWRVLRPDGTLWLDLGDSYSGSGGFAPDAPSNAGDKNINAGRSAMRRFSSDRRKATPGLKAKDLLGMPWRVALALQAAGWTWRSTIVWSKASCMPESVRDRPTNAWEPILLFSKSSRYFYDPIAVAEKSDVDAVSDVESRREAMYWSVRADAATQRVLSEKERAESGSDLQGMRACPRHGMAAHSNGTGVSAADIRKVQRQRGRKSKTPGVESVRGRADLSAEVGGVGRGNGVSAGIRADLPPERETQGSQPTLLPEWQGASSDRSLSANTSRAGIPVTRDSQTPSVASGLACDSQHPDGNGVGNDQDGLPSCLCVLWENGSTTDAGSRRTTVEGWASHSGQYRASVSELQQQTRQPSTRNLRNVWHLGPEPTPEAHFATYPREIPTRAILAGTSARGCCADCGAPWRRVTDSRLVKSPVHGDGSQMRTARENGLNVNGWAGMPRLNRETETLGWQPSCQHNVERIPATVLDPFLGSGQTAIAADRLGRDCIGLELSENYIKMAQRRLAADQRERWLQDRFNFETDRGQLALAWEMYCGYVYQDSKVRDDAR